MTRLENLTLSKRDVSPISRGSAVFDRSDRKTCAVASERKGSAVENQNSAPQTGKALTSADVPLLIEGDVLMHKKFGRFVYSGRVKLADGPAVLEVNQLGEFVPSWRFIPFTAFEFWHRPNGSTVRP